jgi:acyl carrier protein
MDLSDIQRRLTGVFRDIFANDSLEINDNTTAADVPGWDSLKHINLILAVEKAFSIRLTTREIRSLNNVGEFLRLIERKAA